MFPIKSGLSIGLSTGREENMREKQHHQAVGDVWERVLLRPLQLVHQDYPKWVESFCALKNYPESKQKSLLEYEFVKYGECWS